MVRQGHNRNHLQDWGWEGGNLSRLDPAGGKEGSRQGTGVPLSLYWNPQLLTGATSTTFNLIVKAVAAHRDIGSNAAHGDCL